ncbi:hypothetical protein EV363DRAFT_1381746, partial [Boletus edulis]
HVRVDIVLVPITLMVSLDAVDVAPCDRFASRLIQLVWTSYSSISSSMTCLDTPNTSAPSPMIPILVLGSFSPSPLSSMLWGLFARFTTPSGGLCATGGLSGKSPTLFSSC